MTIDHASISPTPSPSNPGTELAIDSQRLWRTVERSAEIGVGRPGGLARLTLTDDDRRMRDEFRAWCVDAGLTVTIDEVGNMFARRAGRENQLPPVVMGSHLDTQFNGGRFDGILGVLSAFPVFSRWQADLTNFVFDNFVPAAGRTVQGYLTEFANNASQATAIGIVVLLISAVLFYRIDPVSPLFPEVAVAERVL